MELKKCIWEIGKVLVVSVLLTAVLLMIAAWILYKADMSGTLEHVMIVIVYLFACLTGGYLLGRKQEKRRFLWGAGFGALYFLFLIIASALAPAVAMEEGGHMTETGEMAEKIRVFLICVFSGMAGGMLS